jgi:hypothetical protein
MHPRPELSSCVKVLEAVGKTSPEKPFHVFGYSVPECPPDSSPVPLCPPPAQQPCSRKEPLS